MTTALAVVKTRAKVSLSDWIQEARAEADDESGPCIAIGCIHVGSGNVIREIDTKRLGSGQKEWTSTDLGAHFQRKAETFAQELPGAQTFNLLAFYSKSSERVQLGISENAGGAALQPRAIHPFVVFGRLNEGENGYNSLMTEPPTEKGVTGQGQRMVNEMFNRLCAQQNVVFAQQNQMIHELHQEAKDAKAEAKDSLLIVVGMLRDQMKAENDQKMAQLAFARSSEERKLWISFGPAVINAIAGKEIFPENITDTAMVELLADNVDEETVQLIGAKLAKNNPEKLQMVMGPMMARFTAAQEKKKRLKEQEGATAKRLAMADPAVDASGAAQLPAKGQTE